MPIRVQVNSDFVSSGFDNQYDPVFALLPSYAISTASLSGSRHCFDVSFLAQDLVRLARFEFPSFVSQTCMSSLLKTTVNMPLHFVFVFDPSEPFLDVFHSAVYRCLQITSFRSLAPFGFASLFSVTFKYNPLLFASVKLVPDGDPSSRDGGAPGPAFGLPWMSWSFEQQGMLGFV